METRFATATATALAMLVGGCGGRGDGAPESDALAGRDAPGAVDASGVDAAPGIETAGPLHLFLADAKARVRSGLELVVVQGIGLRSNGWVDPRQPDHAWVFQFNDIAGGGAETGQGFRYARVPGEPYPQVVDLTVGTVARRMDESRLLDSPVISQRYGDASASGPCPSLDASRATLVVGTLLSLTITNDDTTWSAQIAGTLTGAPEDIEILAGCPP
jgi:hypothetical protein